jgi:hypothetical protein
MPTPNEKLAASLAVLQELEKGGQRVFQSNELTRVHRTRLLQNESDFARRLPARRVG